MFRLLNVTKLFYFTSINIRFTVYKKFNSLAIGNSDHKAVHMQTRSSDNVCELQISKLSDFVHFQNYLILFYIIFILKDIVFILVPYSSCLRGKNTVARFITFNYCLDLL